MSKRVHEAPIPHSRSSCHNVHRSKRCRHIWHTITTSEKSAASLTQAPKPLKIAQEALTSPTPSVVLPPRSKPGEYAPPDPRPISAQPPQPTRVGMAQMSQALLPTTSPPAIYTRAASNDAATQGAVFQLGPNNNNTLKITLNGNGWGTSAHGVSWIGSVNGVSESFSADLGVHLIAPRSPPRTIKHKQRLNRAFSQLEASHRLRIQVTQPLTHPD
jgi:hypothetical protein